MTSVAEFEKFLQGHDTATAALVAWCRRYDGRGADDLAVTLLSDRVAQPDEYQGPLRPCAGETLQCRRVRLRWGQRVVSEAENWYVPQRLPVVMRRILAEGALPFGAVVAELMPRRTTMTMLRCEAIAGGGGEAAALLEQLARAQVFSPPEAFVLHVHAVMTASGVMLADVREHYRRELLMS